MLYLLQSGEFYKIGYSKDFKTLRSRMNNYKTDNPYFKLLDINLGTRDDETKVHRDIKLDSGEWSKDKETTLDLWFKLKQKTVYKVLKEDDNSKDYNHLLRTQLQETSVKLNDAKIELAETKAKLIKTQEEIKQLKKVNEDFNRLQARIDSHYKLIQEIIKELTELKQENSSDQF